MVEVPETWHERQCHRPDVLVGNAPSQRTIKEQVTNLQAKLSGAKAIVLRADEALSNAALLRTLPEPMKLEYKRVLTWVGESEPHGQQWLQYLQDRRAEAPRDLHGRVQRHPAVEGAEVRALAATPPPSSPANVFREEVLLKLVDQETSNIFTSFECPVCFEQEFLGSCWPSCGHRTCRRCTLKIVEHCERQGGPPRCVVCRSCSTMQFVEHPLPSKTAAVKEYLKKGPVVLFMHPQGPLAQCAQDLRLAKSAWQLLSTSKSVSAFNPKRRLTVIALTPRVLADFRALGSQGELPALVSYILYRPKLTTAMEHTLKGFLAHFWTDTKQEKHLSVLTFSTFEKTQKLVLSKD